MASPLFRSRIAVRLYLAGLAQLAAIALLFVVLTFFFASPMERMVRQSARFMAEGICSHAANPGELAREVARVRSVLRSDVEVSDAAGHTVAGAPPEGRRHDADASVTCVAEARETLTVRYWVSPVEPPPGYGLPILAIVLLIVAGPAWLAARTLVRPLSRLASAARSFGAGDLEARASLRRQDELGDVALAFDQMADRMAAMLRAEKELLANVSHELRTPLARIHVALDLAAEGAQLERESLADIARDLGELERIVSDVLATARVGLVDGSGAGALPVRLAETDVGELISAATTRLRARHPDRRLTVSITTPLPLLLADGVLLRRALENLLDNADKYSDRMGAEIGVVAKVDGERLVLEVRDEGAGMSEEDVARAFDPFFRSDRSRSRATGGLGLGLALTRKIVEAHGGSIRMTSHLGKGTVVRMELPIERAAEQPPAR